MPLPEDRQTPKPLPEWASALTGYPELPDQPATPDGPKGAGESTHFRSSSALAESAKFPRSASDVFRKAPTSNRIHGRAVRGGLVTRLALPILVALLIGFLFTALIIRDRMSNLLLNDLLADVSNTAYSTALTGRLLITHRDMFLQNNPEYLQRAEWLTGDHWLVTHGFVNPGDWVEATGFQLDEYAPSSILDKAGEATILAPMSRYVNSPRADSEIVAVYILNADSTPLATARKQSFRLDPLAIKSVPPPDNPLEIGGARITVDYIDHLEGEPIVRGIARIIDYHEPERIIGSAIVIMRTHRHQADQASILMLLVCLGILLLILMAATCWYSARQVTMPMRQMIIDMQAIADGDYSRRAPMKEGDELGLLAQSFNAMAERLRIARLNEKETSRLESDLAIAREIQNNLLPAQTPRVRGLDMYTAYRPAKEIGGDYYDFLPVDDRHVGIAVADASGKSIPAALVMSTTRAILRFVAPGSSSAAETLSRVNAILSVDIPKGMFVTAYYVILDPLGRTMLCASAGHTPLLIARADGSVELLNPGGIALGFDSGPIFQRSIREQRVGISSGDRVLLYTDGVVECVNPANEEYSDRRLREFLRRHRDLDSHDFVGALMADLDRHRGAAEMRDDTTIVTFKVL
ncbi:MAG: SpoIIE family protein phosphatase [Planctomycetaceae bacterium]|nr:SpoIIE family protein phosphatase [Planctomycetaceae bacterium]